MTKDIYGVLFKKYAHVVNKYVAYYGWAEGYSEFRQKLMIALWEYIEKKLKDGTQDSVDKLFLGGVKYLSLRLFFNYLTNKQNCFENGFEDYDKIPENCHLEDSPNCFNEIYNIVENHMNDNHKRIIYAFDSLIIGEKVSYKKIAKQIGMNQRIFYHYIKQIRGILTKNMQI